MHNYSFQKQLNQTKDRKLILAIFKQLKTKIPGVIGGRQATPKEDHKGCDIYLRTANGREIGIDLKIRDKDCRAFGNDDVALEISSVEGAKTGWTLDTSKTTEYIVWYWRDTQRIHIVPFALLQAAFIKYQQEWIDTYSTATQTTDHRYRSSCVFVPAAVVWQAMGAI